MHFDCDDRLKRTSCQWAKLSWCSVNGRCVTATANLGHSSTSRYGTRLAHPFFQAGQVALTPRPTSAVNPTWLAESICHFHRDEPADIQHRYRPLLPSLSCSSRGSVSSGCGSKPILSTRMVQLPATPAIEYVAACCRTRTRTKTKTKTGTKTKSVRGAYARSPQVQCVYEPSIGFLCLAS